jgi:hypothetical protein
MDGRRVKLKAGGKRLKATRQMQKAKGKEYQISSIVWFFSDLFDFVVELKKGFHHHICICHINNVTALTGLIKK